MEINTNFDASGIRASATPRPRRAGGARPALDVVSFPKSAALTESLRGVPDTRVDAVNRARSLVNDPAYPSPAVVKSLAALFASHAATGSVNGPQS